MVAQNSTDGDTAAFLAHLMRGGSVGYWWRGADKRSVWWPAARPDWAAAAGGVDLYFGVCPGDGSRRAGSERNTAESVAAVNAVWCDVDAKDHGGDMAAALAVVQRAPLPPSAIVNSGGGYHGYWLLDEPYQIGGDDARRAQIAGLLKRWTVAVGGDRAVGDLPRILRLPGTFNGKAGGRRAVTWHSLDMSRVYSVADIEAALAAVEARQAVAQPRLPPVSSGRALPAADDADRARRALRLLAAWRRDDYGEWVRVGMTMAELGPVGLALWDDWSRGSAKYEPGACEAKWRTFGSEGVGLGTLHTMAREDDPTGYAAEFGGGRLIAAGAAAVSSGAPQRAAAVSSGAPQQMVYPTVTPFDRHDAPPMTAADVGLLPRCMADMVTAVSLSTELAPQLATWSGLAVASATLATRLTVCYAGREPENVNVYLLGMGNSGLRKSSVFKAMFQPLRDLEQAEVLAARVDVEWRQSEARARQQRIDQLEKQRGKATGDEDLRLREELRRLIEEKATEPAAVHPRRASFGEITPEALGRALADHGRWAILSDEGEILDASTRYAANGGNNNDVFLTGWDGRGGSIDRVRETIVIPQGATLTIGVLTQPQRFAEFVGDQRNVDRGLVQRFLLVAVEQPDGVPSSRTPQVAGSVRRQWADAIQFLDTVAGEITVPDGTAAAAVIKAEEDYNNRLRARGARGGYADYGDMATSWGAKLIQSGTVRLFGVLAALFAYDAQEGPNAATWGAATLERAARAAVMITRLTRAHTLSAYVRARQGRSVNVAQVLAEEYLSRLDGRGLGIWSRRDLHRRCYRVLDIKAVEAGLEELHERGIVCLAHPDDRAAAYDNAGRLRKSARLTVNPAWYADTAEPIDVILDVPAATAQIAAPVAVATQPAQIAAHDPRLYAWRPNADDPRLADMWNPDTGEWDVAVGPCDLVRDDVTATNSALRAYLGIEEVHHAGDQAHRER